MHELRLWMVLQISFEFIRAQSDSVMVISITLKSAKIEEILLKFAVSAFYFRRVSSKANLVKTDLLTPSDWEKMSKIKTNDTVLGRSTGHVATCWRSLNEETKRREKNKRNWNKKFRSWNQNKENFKWGIPKNPPWTLRINTPLMILPPSNKGTRTIRTRPLHTVNIIIKMITDKRCAAPLNSDTQINCGAFEGHEWGGGGGEGVRGGAVE